MREQIEMRAWSVHAVLPVLSCRQLIGIRLRVHVEKCPFSASACVSAK